MKIYLVEDAKELAEIIRKYFTREGYDIRVFDDGETAMQHIRDRIDLWILDIMLPGEITGLDLIEAIKKDNPMTAVMFTSARDTDIDKIRGFDLGGEDYLAKPYSPKELLLRVNALLRRKNNMFSTEIIKYDAYEINITKRIIIDEDQHIDLTNKEFELLLFFLRNQNKQFKRKEILTHVWGDNYYGSDRVVDDLLRRLRHKMPKLKIETIYGYGYRLL